MVRIVETTNLNQVVGLFKYLGLPFDFYKGEIMENKYIRPRVKPIYPVYKLNELLFRIGAQLGITTEFEDPEGKLYKLVSILDGRELSDIFKYMKSEFPDLTEEDIIDGLDILSNEDLIEESEDFSKYGIDERYIPNINYFSRFMKYGMSAYEIQKKINDSTILLLGLGGGGSNILTLLSGLGPRKIIIVDYDKVEKSNLGRQLLYKESDLGQLKVDVAVRTLKEMNSTIDVEGHNKKIERYEDVLEYTKGVDLVICVIDEPPFIAQKTVNKAIVEAKIPCVFGASQVSRGRVFSVIPNMTGCFDCLNIHYTLHDDKFVEQFVGFRDIDFNPPTVAYAPAMYQLTAAIVDEAVRILTGYAEPRSLSTQYEINYEDGSSFTHPSWTRYEEDCPTCGNGKSDKWEIFRYYDRK